MSDGRLVQVEPQRLAGWLDRFRDRHGEVTTQRDRGVLHVTAPDGATATFEPPWPFDGDDLPGLVEHVLRPRSVAFVLVRRGGFAAAVANGGELVASKVGSRHVQGRTKAGGWSQQRYARRRTAQAGTAYAAAAEAAVGVLVPRAAGLDGLVTGGDRAAVSAVLSDPRLRVVANLPAGPFLAVPDPRRRVLEEAVRRSRAVRVEVYDPDLDGRT